MAKSEKSPKAGSEKMRTRLVLFLMFTLILSACSSFEQAASASQPVFEPTDLPMGTPVPDWKGIPVIPGANEGKPAGFGYIYSVNVTVDEVGKFYIEKMKLNGWVLLNRKASETSIFGGPSAILDFQKGDSIFNTMLAFSTNDDYTIVVMTQVK